eukprot:TRINITY_DN4590_c0_g1_i1.p1 TRINITY_DN4590_c0_g1~~TRINITY_DN4590_c0_g1_i1.p1  ORF type:complete len:148 (+),score=26.35 TRINITY_DN4590_c0_g1_i1:87-530(+)
MAADEQRARTGAASPQRSTCSRKDTSKRYARGDAHLFEFVAEGGHLIHSGATSCAASVKETMSSTSDFLCALAGQILGFDDSQGQVTLCAGPRRRVPERAPAVLETPKVVRVPEGARPRAATEYPTLLPRSFAASLSSAVPNRSTTT